MISNILSFFKTGPDLVPPINDNNETKREYNWRRWSVFLSITFGYGFYYICRLTISVVKQPLIDAGIMSAAELGKIGSVMLFSYAIGKFLNGLLADHCNIRRFMSMGLLISALLNIALGFTPYFYAFMILWGLNGYFQSMGCAPSIVALNQWFSNHERGTRYGIWYISHSIGEGLTFIGTAALVSTMGWRWGFWGAGISCVIAAVIMSRTLADRPQTYGLPAIADYKNDHSAISHADRPTFKLQLEVLRSPIVWTLAIASALTYVSRYAINSWGMLYLQKAKGLDLIDAGKILSICPFVGIIGAILCGIISDRLFKSSRHATTLIYGILQTSSLIAFFYLIPPGHPWLDIIAIGVFGFSVSGVVAFLGGLTAVDLMPKKATGAVMGFIGLFSYIGASVQDWVSGALIEAGKYESAGTIQYDFSDAKILWVSASAISILLACTVWKAKPME